MAEFKGFTPKQKEYIRNAHSLYNIKSGATRSGKTFLDTAYTIPMAIRERRGKEGLSIILGVTRSTIERNVLQPMREFYTDKLVGRISSDNTCALFGETVYCLGAEKISQQSKIRGAGFKYVYGDEVAEWNKEVFDLLLSRLDKSYSRFDGTCNPYGPKHWLKQFIDSGEGVYYQAYSIFDNPTLSKQFIDTLWANYRGTVLEQRYIFGRWVAAEGACYPQYANEPEKYRVSPKFVAGKLKFINLGIDFGGSKSATTFVATGFMGAFDKVVVLRSAKLTGIITPEQLNEAFHNFAIGVYKDFGTGMMTGYADSAEQTLIAGLRAKAAKARTPCIIKNALKTPINDRIALLNALIATGRFWVLEGNEQVEKAMGEAVYKPNQIADERLDDGTTDIDTCDALEYTIEPHGRNLLLRTFTA